MLYLFGGQKEIITLERNIRFSSRSIIAPAIIYLPLCLATLFSITNISNIPSPDRTVTVTVTVDCFSLT